MVSGDFVQHSFIGKIAQTQARLAPAAAGDPSAGRRGFHRRPDRRQGFVNGRTAGKIDLQFAGRITGEVGVGIGQCRQQPAPPGIDPFRFRAGQAQDVRIAAQRQDAVAPDRQGAGR